MKNSISLSLKEARNIAIESQLLKKHGSNYNTKDSIYNIVNHLGYIQIDTISVVERAHNHTISSRCHQYSAELLSALISPDKKLFEYWAHGISFIPINDYRFYLPKIKRFDAANSWYKERYPIAKKYFPEILKRIREEGALCSKDFKHTSSQKRNGWWDWKPAKTALELLYLKGELMISHRHKFQRYYDLTENVLPKDINTSLPNNDEIADFAVNRALQAHGIATEYDICDYIHLINKQYLKQHIQKMADDGRLIKIDIEKIENSVYYALPGLFEGKNATSPNKDAFILSPFDNFVINRNRILQLFDYDYKIECYVPAAKRKFGYFSLPVLYGSKLVARMDAKADRKNKLLIIKAIHFEKGFKFTDRFKSTFSNELQSFMHFNKCESISLEECYPAKFRENLEALIQLIRR